VTKPLRKAKGNAGNQVVKYRHIDGQVFDANVTGFTAGALSTPGVPTVTPQGTTGGNTYRYQIVARNSSGVTVGGTGGQTTSGNAALSATNFNRVTWSAVTGAESYDVYGRTQADGSTLFIKNVVGTTFDDDGTLTPSGALPGGNTTAAGYNIRIPQLKTSKTSTVSPGSPISVTPATAGVMLKLAVQVQTSRAQTGVLLSTGAR
jgi:hypothetical protein